MARGAAKDAAGQPEAAAAAATVDFERSLSELEQLVERIEQGELPLAEALKQFERGVELVRDCERALSDAEQRVDQLLEQNGEIVAVPLDGAAPPAST